jgi:hypothetical protein
MTDIKYVENSKGQKISPYKSDPEVMKANYNRIKRDKRFNMLDKTISWGILLTPIFILTMLLLTCSSCSTTHCITNNGENDVYTPSNYVERTVIDKRIENYGYYVVALDNGDTYYTTYGEYSLIHVHDTILFKKKWNGSYKLIKIK